MTPVTPTSAACRRTVYNRVRQLQTVCGVLAGGDNQETNTLLAKDLHSMTRAEQDLVMEGAGIKSPRPPEELALRIRTLCNSNKQFRGMKQ